MTPIRLPVEPVSRPPVEMGYRMLLLAGLGGGTTCWTLGWLLLAQWIDAVLVLCIGGVFTVIGAGCTAWAALALVEDWTRFQVWRASLTTQAAVHQALATAQIAALVTGAGVEGPPVSPPLVGEGPAIHYWWEGDALARVAAIPPEPPRPPASLPSGDTQRLPVSTYIGSPLYVLVEAITTGQGYSVRAMQGRLTREQLQQAMDLLIQGGLMARRGERTLPAPAPDWRECSSAQWHAAAGRLWDHPSPTEG